MKMKNLYITLCETSDLSSIDLLEEIASSEETVECAILREINSDGYIQTSSAGELVYFPQFGRFACAWGSDAIWGDACSLADAVTVHAAGEFE